MINSTGTHQEHTDNRLAAFKRAIGKFWAGLRSIPDGSFAFTKFVWETLVAPCAPVTLDFEYWGLDLPVLPVEGQHYVGIQELDGRSVANKLSGLGHERLEEIGSAGKAWFEEHYSPRVQAGRLLNELSSRGHSIPD